MKNKEAWIKFKDSGLLWLINGLLHNFGYVIAYEYDVADDLIDVRPMKADYTGFTRQVQQEGHWALSEYLNDIGTKAED